MEKRYLSPAEFAKLYPVNDENSVDAAQVSENLSGQAQLLKSSDNSVSYKNFNGSEIDETALVQESYQRTLNTDLTEQYDAGVTTTQIETAPSIKRQINLSQSHTANIIQLNETIHTLLHKHTDHIDQSEEYAQTRQTTIPTHLQQTLQQSGSSSINQLKSQIGTQSIQSDNYTQQFDTLNFNGPINVNSHSSFLGAQKIYIGGRAPDSRIDCTLNKTGDYFPTVSGEVFSENLKLAPLLTPRFYVTGEVNLQGTLDAQYVCSVDPVTFDEAGFHIKLTRAINSYFGNMHIASVNDLNSASLPEIDIDYSYGQITFSSSMGIQVYASKKGYIKVIYTHPPSETHVEIHQLWELDMTTQVTLTAKFYPVTKAPLGLAAKMENLAHLFWQGLQQEYEIAKPYLPLAVPEEEPLAAGAKEVWPILLKLGPMVFQARQGLERATY